MNLSFRPIQQCKKDNTSIKYEDISESRENIDLHKKSNTIKNNETNNNKIYVTNMKSKEELELDSKLVTEREIYNLGIIQATKKKEEEEYEEKFKVLFDYYLQHNKNDINKLTEEIIKENKYLTLQSFFQNYNEFITILIKTNKKKENEIDKLKIDRDDLDTQVNDLIEETDSLSNDISGKNSRIENLRNKCKHKNKIFKTMIFLNIISNFNFYIIGKIGFIIYLNHIKNIIYIIFNYIL